MEIHFTREAVCLADDQIEPLKLTLGFDADATLDDLAMRIVRSGFLHFSSTHHTLTGRLAGTPLVKIKSQRSLLFVEHLLSADTRISAVITAGAVIDFRFEHIPALRPMQADLGGRRPVWLALSDLFLDTDVNLFHESNTRLLAASPYSLAELDAILREEVYPACSANLTLVAGEWAGFDADWLERRILCGGPPPRPWWRRWQRYLTLGWTVPVQLPSEWTLWREDIIRLRAGVAGDAPSA